jgi:RecB family endonuclease NucS
MRAAGHLAEFTVRGGRIDGLTVDAANKTLHVIELKPNNARAIREGRQQLRRYVRELQDMDRFKGFSITTEVRTYN